MTTGQYTPLQEIPDYSENPALHPHGIVNLESNLNQRSSIAVHDLSRKQVTAGCLLCSILNYICCPWLGIPALIFAILGLEAEKRQEIEAAKSHAFHLKIFNIIYAVKCAIGLLASCVCFTILIVVWVVVANAVTNGSKDYYNRFNN